MLWGVKRTPGGVWGVKRTPGGVCVVGCKEDPWWCVGV